MTLPRLPTPKKDTTDVEGRKRFIEALSKVGVVTHAAELAGVDRSHMYAVREADPVFAKAWDDAIDASADVLEKEMFRRAVDGVEEPVYQGGELVGHIRKYSDTLLIFALKGQRPGKHREKQPDGGAVEAIKSVADMFRIMAERDAARGRVLPSAAPAGNVVIDVVEVKNPTETPISAPAESEPKKPGPLITRRKREEEEPN